MVARETASTIFALATPASASAAALLRIAGSQARVLAQKFCGSDWKRRCVQGSIRLPIGTVPCIAWLMPAPHTLTGRDTLEILVPGNVEIVRDLERLLRECGCHDAEPGAFTRLAVEAGKLSLAQAEATLALVTSSDEVSRRRALADLGGESARRLTDLAARLRTLSARYEMSFDFSEEEHALAQEDRLSGDLRALLADLRAFVGREGSQPRREFPSVALFGPPNAGKSSLFNALVGQRRALVSATPGTTRDAIEADAVFDGCACKLLDLSGVGAGDADLGRYAPQARQRALAADVLLVLCAPGQAADCAHEFTALTRQDAALRSRALWVQTMSDLAAQEANPCGLPQYAVSAASGQGLAALREQLGVRLGELATGGSTSLLRLNATAALTMLEVAAADPLAPTEAVAADVRRALTLLDQALLNDAPGDVLDLIFSRFCIGK
ncbi:MAG: 50S ribosome-binding GTPase [Planctomycetes bacterium]|nr:50S ribosome-binding GTPase [Planctomycetota bacterium]